MTERTLPDKTLFMRQLDAARSEDTRRFLAGGEYFADQVDSVLSCLHFLASRQDEFFSVIKDDDEEAFTLVAGGLHSKNDASDQQALGVRLHVSGSPDAYAGYDYPAQLNTTALTVLYSDKTGEVQERRVDRLARRKPDGSLDIALDAEPEQLFRDGDFLLNLSAKLRQIEWFRPSETIRPGLAPSSQAGAHKKLDGSEARLSEADLLASEDSKETRLAKVGRALGWVSLKRRFGRTRSSGKHAKH